MEKIDIGEIDEEKRDELLAKLMTRATETVEGLIEEWKDAKIHPMLFTSCMVPIFLRLAIKLTIFSGLTREDLISLVTRMWDKYSEHEATKHNLQ